MEVQFMNNQTILIIEDEPTINRILAKYFTKEGYAVYSALNGKKGLELFDLHAIDLVCLDIMIPQINGWEVAKTIRETSNTPIILMSALSTEEDILKGFSLHVDDYITKPFPPSVLLAKIKGLFERIEIERNCSTIDGVFNIEGIDFDVMSFNDSEILKELLSKDELTGISNRRFLEYHIANMIKEVRDFHTDFGILFIDIDHFKHVNDEYGHNTGDIILRELATVLKHNIRKDDLIGRWGGEEFVAIIKVEKANQLFAIGEKLRNAIQDFTFDAKNNQLDITISLGGALYNDGETIKDIIKRADQNMYLSKNSGRNKVTVN